jgi:hypothetical protein
MNIEISNKTENREIILHIGKLIDEVHLTILPDGQTESIIFA